MNNWISVEDELPEERKLVLVIQDMTGVCLRAREEGDWWYDENEIMDDSELEITHWMYLPEPPNE